jgi:hypothetical protein
LADVIGDAADLSDQGRRAGLTSFLLFAVIAVLGMAMIAVLPPWEGFDETAHWSSIQQMADTAHVPVYGVDRLSADRLSWFGPEPRGIDQRGRLYTDLHQTLPKDTRVGPTRYSPDGPLNWQSQHPPLFYALMVPVYRAAHGLSWVDHLMALRLACWAMACVGLGLGALATWRMSGRASEGLLASPWLTPLSLMWPLLFAGYFADLARLGNDSLCLLIFGALWWVLLPMLADGEGRGQPIRAVALGLLIGAGLWTKAFFGPVSLGVGALLLARSIRSRRTLQGLDLTLAVGIGWAIGAGWYLMKWRTTGALTGSDESVQLLRAGGMMHGLAEHFSALGVARGVGVMLETVGWAFTWSLARLSEIAMAGVVALLVGVGIGYGAKLRQTRSLVAWAPLAIMAPLIAGLLYHQLTRAAIDGLGSTPAWYLHVVAPALGLAMAIGWVRARLFAALGLFSLLYTAVSWAAELSMFSGCTPIDESKHYAFARAACLVDGRALGLVGHPVLAATTLIAATALAVWAAMAARPAWPLRSDPSASTLIELQPL